MRRRRLVVRLAYKAPAGCSARFAAALALWAVIAGALAQQPDAPPPAPRVVILNATDPYLPAFRAFDGALREAIQSASAGRREFFAETLDMHRFPRNQFEREVATLLRMKYQGLKVDVVVAVTRISLEFARRNGAEIWPGAAIVFSSVRPSDVRRLNLDPGTIGVPEAPEFDSTLELLMKLRPGTRRIALVAGAAEPDKDTLSLAEGALARYPGRLETIRLVGLSVANTLEVVRGLPQDAVVLYVNMYRDGEGLPQVPREVLSRIAAVSSVPVFGVFETYLGHGIVAGSLASYAAQGRRVGELVSRVLNGEDPAGIGVQPPVRSDCIADWRQLRRWKIDVGLLPGDCEIRFREPTVWDTHRWEILAAAAVMLIQAVLIGALLLSRRRIQRARADLRGEFARRRQAESVATDLRDRLARFGRERSLGAMATAIAHEVNQPLVAIQNYAQAARRRLKGDTGDRSKLIELFEKIEAQAERAGTITQSVRSLVSTSDPQLAPASLASLLEEVIRIVEPEAAGRGCRIACELGDRLPAVLADALQVQLVLVNLLRNAMRSVCGEGRYDRSIAVEARVANNREVRISVIDGGPGVPPDQVEEVFEPHFSRTSGGMGMGLAICRDIIAAHGGTLRYEPNPAGGAIFRFTLRSARA